MKQEEIKYSVIGKWVEPDGSEQWDVLSNEPLLYEDALKISTNAGKSWENNCSEEYKNLQHEEIIVSFEELQKILDEEKLK